jgi:hypothetical protein
MKTVSTLLVAAVLLLLPAHPAAGQPAELTAQEREELAKLVAEVDDAASALDIERFLRWFVDGPHFAYAIDGRVYTRAAEVRTAHTAAWSKVKSARIRSTVERAATLGPGAMTVTATGRAEVVLKSGETRVSHYAITAALVRTPEGWRILQAHDSSVPSP